MRGGAGVTHTRSCSHKIQMTGGTRGMIVFVCGAHADTGPYVSGSFRRVCGLGGRRRRELRRSPTAADDQTRPATAPPRLRDRRRARAAEGSPQPSRPSRRVYTSSGCHNEQRAGPPAATSSSDATPPPVVWDPLKKSHTRGGGGNGGWQANCRPAGQPAAYVRVRVCAPATQAAAAAETIAISNRVKRILCALGHREHDKVDLFCPTMIGKTAINSRFRRHRRRRS
ncbi:hypothetical protein QTP88_021755 [Uroleucon formosanum]